MPAHVTVLHPFTPNVDDAIVNRLAHACEQLQPFDAWFASTGRFPGGVVWLHPTERSLRGHASSWPTGVPRVAAYGGAFDEPVPHLTIASGEDQDVADQVDRTVMHQLVDGPPITASVRHLTLLEAHADEHWTVGRTWPLGPT